MHINSVRFFISSDPPVFRLRPHSSTPCPFPPRPSRQQIRQTARIVSLEHPKGVLRTGDRAKVVFELDRPELIRPGHKLLFREGKTKVSRRGTRTGEVAACVCVWLMRCDCRDWEW
jgi:hypothetical protein